MGLTQLHAPLGLDVDGREESGNRSRRPQNLLKMLQGIGSTAIGDIAHVPDHKFGGIQIGGRDVEPSSFGMFARHGRQNLGRYVTFDPFFQWGVVVKGIVQQACQAPLCENVLRLNIEIKLLEQIIILRPQKRKDGHERPGGDACDNVEFRPGAALRPSGKVANPIGTKRTAAGQGQNIVTAVIVTITLHRHRG